MQTPAERRLVKVIDIRRRARVLLLNPLLVVLLSMILSFCVWEEVQAENKVTVESKAVLAGDQTTIGIYLENDESLKIVTLPLVARSLQGGAFMTAWDPQRNPDITSRLSSALTDMNIDNPFANEDGACKNNAAGGFGTLAPPDYVSPDAHILSAGRIFPTSLLLAPGNDFDVFDSQVPSFIIPMTVGTDPGVFTIDTTCTNPANHLLFVGEASNSIVPEFVRGVISVVDQSLLGVWPDCNCSTPEDTITSPFGARFDSDGYDYHQGIDIRSPVDDPVYAILSGLVKKVEPTTSIGSRIEIECPGYTSIGTPTVIMTRNQHLRPDNIPWIPGQSISQGQLLAYTGQTSLPPHIHLETWPDADPEQRAHPVQFLPRFDNHCPGFDEAFDITSPDPRYTLVGPQGAYDRLLCRSSSPTLESLDLVSISVWIYPGGSPGGRVATIDFEDDYFTWKLDGTLDDRTRQFHVGTPYEVEITLAPRNFEVGHDFHQIDITINPADDFASIDWIGVVLQDATYTDCSLETCPIPTQAASSSGIPCPIIGNVSGESPGAVVDFFEGVRIEDAVELVWRGVPDGQATGVRIFRTTTGEDRTPAFDGILPYRPERITDTVRYTDWLSELEGPLTYELAVQFENGTMVFSDHKVEIPHLVSENSAVPSDFVLYQNVPNPFNASTRIRFSVSESSSGGPARVRIYDVLGRRVATPFSTEVITAGSHEFEWDGQNDVGQPVASGIYFYRIETLNGDIGRKMVLLK